jgi:FkbM family methyltransferase
VKRQDRYVFDPGGSARVAGFPSVITNYRPEDLSSYRPDGEHVIVPGRYERDLIDWAAEICPHTQFVDCGAHVGSWTLIMATHFHEVHAFEPQRLIFQQLCGNIALNGLENVFTYNVGLDGVAGQVRLHRPGVDRGAATARPQLLANYPDIGPVTEEIVPVFPLDRYKGLLVDVGLIKIDVEGLELRVVAGAQEMLQANGLPKMIIECWAHDWYQKDKQALVGFLLDTGYRVVPINGYADVILAEKR